MEAGDALRVCVNGVSNCVRHLEIHPISALDSISVPQQTQEALYAQIDLELSWSESELPQVERTKHVHALHPYLGKFVPQLVEVFLRRYFNPGDCIYDPFVGSGTTLVEANVFGCHAVGCDISAFNCLLSKVKTAVYSIPSLELALKGTLENARRTRKPSFAGANEWLRRWYSPRALNDLLAYRASIVHLDAEASDVARVVLTRAARSARLTTHFDLDFPRNPVRAPYYCHKHKRICRPVDEADKFLRRYTTDTNTRLRHFSQLRRSGPASDRSPRRRSHSVVANIANGDHHVPALSRTDRLPRAASVRLRAARPRRSPRIRDRRSRPGIVSLSSQPVCLRYECRLREQRPSAAQRSPGHHCRQRLERALPRDPGEVRPCARRADDAPRESKNRAAGG